MLTLSLSARLKEICVMKQTKEKCHVLHVAFLELTMTLVAF